MGVGLREKIERIKLLKQEWGLNHTLRVLEVSKSTWYYHQNKKVDYEEKYSHVKGDLLQAIERHPVYGWRKLQVELREEYGHRINHKVLKKLLNRWELALPRRITRPRKNRILTLIQEIGDRANLIKKLEAPNPFEVIITDFTWIYYHQGKRKSSSHRL